MGVRLFMSSNSGNKEIENSQQRIQMVLTSRDIQFVAIDISTPGMQEMRSFMRERGRKREGQRNALPPQIFNGEEYKGDYEGFDIANEDNNLEEFLGIPRKNPKAEPVKTGAVCAHVAKKQTGKLQQDENIPVKEEPKIEDSKETRVEIVKKVIVEVQKPKTIAANEIDISEKRDEMSDEESSQEYMSDGELVRKESSGFKALTNCKRFWKASIDCQF